MRRGALLMLMLMVALLPASTARAAPPGLRLAFVRGGDLWLLTGGRERRLTQAGGVSDPHFSYDGRFVTFRQGRRANLVMSTDGSGPWPVSGGWPVQWHPRENTLSVTDGQSVSTVAVTDQGPGAPQSVVTGWGGGIWSPDGLRLAVSRREPSERSMFEGTAFVGIVPRNGGPVTTLLTEKYPVQAGDAAVGGAMPMAWSPDGEWLLLLRGGLTASMAADANQFAVISARGGKVYPLGVSPNIHWAAWAPAGARLAYVDGAGRSAWTRKQMKLAAPPWVQPATLTPDGYADREPAWRPDGRVLAFTRSQAVGPPTMDLPAPGQAIYRLDPAQKEPRRVAGREGGFCPFWDAAGDLYWLKAETPRAAAVYGERGAVLKNVDLPYSYYGQRACERNLTSWSPPAASGRAGSIGRRSKAPQPRRTP